MAKSDIKICGLCKREINLKKDNYCHLEDYKAGKFFGEGWYHIQCYNDNLNAQKQMKDKAMGILNKAAEMIGYKEEKTYEIPAR